MPSFNEGDVAYVKVDTFNAKVLFKEKDAKRPWQNKKEPWKKAGMLWGDQVFIRKITGSKAEVSAKGHRLEIPLSKLTDQSIMCVWQIDCGQGDAAIVRLPDGRYGAIDLGPGRYGKFGTNSARTAVDFLKWIAFQDNNWRFEGANKQAPFHLDWIVLTHPDEDHIGAGQDFAKKLGKYWSVGTVYHPGVARFKGKDAKEFDASATTEKGKLGFSQLGDISGKSEKKLFLGTMIDGWGDVGKYLTTTSTRSWKLGGNYGKILKALHGEKGKSVEKLQRLSHKSDGAALGDSNVDVKILGPIEEEDTLSGKPALRYLDNNKVGGFYDLNGPSLTRNGHSVVLRFDYDEVRIMMTGDLNFKSQALLQKKWDASEFKCHVAKACHHGSDDISWKFLRAMSPLATMFSSGDQETHVHPRALILGLSGGLSTPMKWNKPDGSGGSNVVKQTYDGFTEETLFTPLLYSTELSRSVSLRTDMKAYTKHKNDDGSDRFEAVENTYLKGKRAGEKEVPLENVHVADRITYGLINLRTDGKTIMMAVMEEGNRNKPEFHVEKFRPSELQEL
jgi:beta-lactamase superfamily II metal-dependent hydrolase